MSLVSCWGLYIHKIEKNKIELHILSRAYVDSEEGLLSKSHQNIVRTQTHLATLLLLRFSNFINRSLKLNFIRDCSLSLNQGSFLLFSEADASVVIRNKPKYLFQNQSCIDTNASLPSLLGFKVSPSCCLQGLPLHTMAMVPIFSSSDLGGFFFLYRMCILFLWRDHFFVMKDVFFSWFLSSKVWCSYI